MSGICHELHHWLEKLPRFSFPFDVNRIPANGLYVLYERGETGHDRDRIVRVGTHDGQNRLRSRLQEHLLRENKDRSIFRKNIGRAILNRDTDPFLEFWNLDLTTSAAKQRYSGLIDRDRQQAIEQRVTAYMRENFSFVVLSVQDKADRLHLESKLISTVAQCTECRASKHWLGRHSPVTKIREGGLWLINKLDHEPLTKVELADLMQQP